MKKKELSDYFRKMGEKGGKTTGESKVRGDSEYYRRIRKRVGKSTKKEGR